MLGTNQLQTSRTGQNGKIPDMAENCATEYDLLAWLARVDVVDVEDFDLREGRADVGLSATKVQSLAIRERLRSGG